MHQLVLKIKGYDPSQPANSSQNLPSTDKIYILKPVRIAPLFDIGVQFTDTEFDTVLRTVVGVEGASGTEADNRATSVETELSPITFLA